MHTAAAWSWSATSMAIRFLLRIAMSISLVTPLFVVCDLLISGAGHRLLNSVPLWCSVLYFVCLLVSLDFIPGAIARYRPFRPVHSFVFSWLIGGANLTALFVLLYAWRA